MKIRLKFVYGICPAFIFYVKTLGSDGETRGMLIRIRISRFYMKDILGHELVHVRQFYRMPIIHGILYYLWGRYRLRCEVEAYREQLSYYVDAGPFMHHRKLIEFASLLSKNYRLNITQCEAEELIGG